jgi:endonuclease/exonuclease/phosphatase family metal-dependent hydrolase
MACVWVLCTTASPGQVVPSTQPAEDARAASDRLKVVTYNVLKCRRGIEPIIQILREQDADVIFLQEVGRGGAGSRDQAARIAEALGGMHVVSAATLGLPSTQHCDQAILTRLEVSESAAHSLDEGGWAYAVQTRVKAPGRPLHLLSVHTRSTFQLEPKHVIESSRTRLAQVTQLLEVIRKLEGDVIVAGDFNAAPWMPEYHGITRLLTDFGLLNQAAKPTYPSRRPVVRIDYVFGRGEFAARSYRVLAGRWSDHRPVVTELEREAGETSKSQNVETSKSQKVETSKRRNVETLDR